MLLQLALNSISDPNSIWGKPSVFGLPLGVVLMIFWVLKEINKGDSSKQGTQDSEIEALKKEVLELKKQKNTADQIAAKSPVEMRNSESAIEKGRDDAQKRGADSCLWETFHKATRGRCNLILLEDWVFTRHAEDVFFVYRNDEVSICGLDSITQFANENYGSEFQVCHVSAEGSDNLWVKIVES